METRREQGAVSSRRQPSLRDGSRVWRNRGDGSWLRWRRAGGVMLLGVSSIVAFALANRALAEDAVSAFQARVQPLLKTYCADCHGGEKPKGRIDLSGTRTREQLFAERDL